MTEHFRRPLDIERVSKQLGIDLNKFVNMHLNEQEQGSLHECKRSEANVFWEAKGKSSAHFRYKTDLDIIYDTNWFPQSDNSTNIGG